MHYHGNCVIQGFPALRKAVTTHLKKYVIFYTCVDIANQLLTRRLLLAPLGQVYEWTASFNAFFHLESQRQRTLRLLFEDCRFIYFHSLMKSAFLLSKGLLCLYDKQNNTWLLEDMEFLFSCSTRHLTRSLRSLVSYRVTHRNSISTRAHVLFSIYLMKNHYYTKKGLLGQDLPTIWFAKTLALDEMPRDRANVCGKSSGKSPIVSVKIPESEKHLTPFPRLKATKNSSIV